MNLILKLKRATVLTEKINITVKQMQRLHKKLKKDIKFYHIT